MDGKQFKSCKNLLIKNNISFKSKISELENKHSEGIQITKSKSNF